LVRHLASELSALGASDVDVFELSGHASVLARFGVQPSLLLNAHVDTVPANSGYTDSPFRLTERGEQLVGLGSADTKGAIAAILEALAQRRAAGEPIRDVAVLFSGDEERRGTCMRDFVATPSRMAGLRRAIVCEPTGCLVGRRHRGIGAIEAVVQSPGGHSSRADLVPNPIALLARAAVALDDMGREYRDRGPAGFKGLCLNVAALEGGLAFNVIPTRATLKMSLRPAPGADMDALLADAAARTRAAVAAGAAGTPVAVDWSVVAVNPPFATLELPAFRPYLGDRIDNPIDLGFWTEAAMLVAAGVDAVVFGPGRIEQAHAADEFVDRADLDVAVGAFAGALAAAHAAAGGPGDPRP